MNKEGRKKLDELRTKMGSIMADLESVKDSVQELAEEEREKFDNMPDSLQQGENGQKMDEAATALEALAEKIEEAHDAAQEADGSMDEIATA